jgi:hypothetical protein
MIQITTVVITEYVGKENELQTIDGEEVLNLYPQKDGKCSYVMAVIKEQSRICSTSCDILGNYGPYGRIVLKNKNKRRFKTPQELFKEGYSITSMDCRMVSVRSKLPTSSGLVCFIDELGEETSSLQLEFLVEL